MANSCARNRRMTVSAKRSGCAAVTFAASSSAATVAGWMPAPVIAEIDQAVSARTRPSWPAAIRASSTASWPCRVLLGQVASQEGRVGQQDLGPRRERRIGRAG